MTTVTAAAESYVCLDCGQGGDDGGTFPVAVMHDGVFHLDAKGAIERAELVDVPLKRRRRR
jgi:hypothetical protein